MHQDKLQVNLDSDDTMPKNDPKNCFYLWNAPSGILQLSTNPRDLEALLAGIEISEDGASIELSRPPLKKEPVAFSGVKRIEPIHGLKDEEYLWIPDYTRVK